LLEILLALGLMLLLIAAVSQSMTIFLRLSTLGREETEQAQIARGVLQQFDKDIGSITFTPADKEDFASDDFGGEEVAAERLRRRPR
jgi:type II secretory pathway pseudopilin PulG